MRVPLGVTLAKGILLLAALQAAPLSLAAQRDEALSRLFPPRPTGYVTDVAGVLDAGVEQRLNDLAERLRAATGAELAIVVLPTIGDRAPVDVAVAIGRAWGVGAKAAVGDARRNAGLVVLLVPRRLDDDNSGHIFIATGQGLEGIVTDLQAGRARDLMTPYFRSGDYARGLEEGARALAGLIAREMGVTDSALLAGRRLDRAPAARPGLLLIVFWLIVVIFIFARLSRATGGRHGRRRRRSPWPWIFWGGGGGFGSGGGFGGFGGGGFGGGGFGGFGGGGGFSGGGAGGRF